MAMLGPWKYQKGRNFRHPGEREGYGTESNQVKSRRELYFHAETKEKGEISEGGKKISERIWEDMQEGGNLR